MSSATITMQRKPRLKLLWSLDKYFDVLIADIPDGVGKDWDEMDVEDIYDVFAYNLKTVREFNLG